MERIDLVGDWRRVSPRYAWAELWTAAIWGLVLAAALGTFLWFVTDWPRWIVVVGAVALLLLLSLSGLLGFLRVRTIGFAMRDDDLLVRRGMLFRRFVSVPYGRMQVVDVTQGPLERMLDLKTLKFVTAAATSAVTIPGLPGSDAEVLRDELVAVAESRRAGL
ncbi:MULTISPECIES: PH domain-containing protein [unclassified Agrococcus]|uniref:PH domain-containing protein n=1 Tax=unclassified Agrococcus TaxID=2615065 RepID=UPI00360DE5FD